MAFIQVQQSLVTHRKTLRLARLLNLDRYTVVGRLVALWSWCLDNAPGGALGPDIDADMLADVMGWSEQMGHPSELLEALIVAGFLAWDPIEQRLRLVGWDDLRAHGALPDDESTDESANDQGDDEEEV